MAVNADMAQRAGDPTNSGLTARTVSAGVLAPVVLAAVYFGAPFYEIVIGLMALILAWEWNRLCGGSRSIRCRSATSGRHRAPGGNR